jgi:hypothetical protein
MPLPLVVRAFGFGRAFLAGSGSDAASSSSVGGSDRSDSSSSSSETPAFFFVRLRGKKKEIDRRQSAITVAEPEDRRALGRRSLALGAGWLLLLLLLGRSGDLQDKIGVSLKDAVLAAARAMHLGLAQRLERLVGQVNPDPVLLDVVLVGHRPEEVAWHLDVARIRVERPVV